MLNLIISGFQGARGVKYVIIIVLYKPHAHGFAAAVHTLYIHRYTNCGIYTACIDSASSYRT